MDLYSYSGSLNVRTAPNRKRLYQIADVIETYPERHDQDSWIENDDGEAESSVIYNGEEISCGTTQCVAGWALILNNGGLQAVDSSSVSDEYIFAGNSTASAYSIMHDAASILGLSEDDAHTLFYASDIDDYESFDMPRVLREIADGRPVVDAVDEAMYRVEGFYADCTGVAVNINRA